MTRLTKEVAKSLCLAIASGAYPTFRDAAQHVGVHPDTLYDWRAKNPVLKEALDKAKEISKDPKARQAVRESMIAEVLEEEQRVKNRTY